MKRRNVKFYSICDEIGEFSPCRKLLAQYLTRAVLDLEVPDARIVMNAINWFKREDCIEWSFVWTCQFLDINAEALRLRLQDEYPRYKLLQEDPSQEYRNSCQRETISEEEVKYPFPSKPRPLKKK